MGFKYVFPAQTLGQSWEGIGFWCIYRALHIHVKKNTVNYCINLLITTTFHSIQYLCCPLYSLYSPFLYPWSDTFTLWSLWRRPNINFVLRCTVRIYTQKISVTMMYSTLWTLIWFEGPNFGSSNLFIMVYYNEAEYYIDGKSWRPTLHS